MGLIHGNQGKVFLNSGEVADVVQWELREEVQFHAYTSSATGPTPAVVAGKRQLLGNCHLLLSTGFDALGALSPGGTVTLKLQLDSSRFFQFTANVLRLDVLKSKHSGEPDRLRFQFVSVGHWTRPTWN